MGERRARYVTVLYEREWARVDATWDSPPSIVAVLTRPPAPCTSPLKATIIWDRMCALYLEEEGVGGSGTHARGESGSPMGQFIECLLHQAMTEFEEHQPTS